jgi:4-alpha-glucanotransferase
MTREPEELAGRYGIATQYKGLDGTWHVAPKASIAAILGALGVDPDAAVLPEPVITPQSDPNRAIQRCYLPEWLEQGRAWGIAVQVYALRSDENWGIGDLRDLALFARTAAESGADFLGTNPLHALFLADAQLRSPFFPSNRRFLNPLYIAVDAVPGYSPVAAEQQLAAELRQGDLIDYAGVTRLKLAALRRIRVAWREAAATSTDYSIEAFAQFQEAGGEALRRHALFEALSFELAAEGHGGSWKRWPAEFASPSAAGSRAYAEAHPEVVEFYSWLQWLTAVQLQQAQRAARESGMRIGLYLDFAVGEAPDGSAAWSDPFVMMRGVDVGAPPDYFSTSGQNWGLAPISPRALVERDFGPYRELIGATMPHSGALRIDHVMGIQQMFLIPEGHAALEGTYIHYPLRRMIEALAAASHRHEAVLIGEDLGYVPEGFREIMEQAAILSYRILYFEQDAGWFKAASDYPRMALACLSTHDLPTLEGWWRGEDVGLRRQFGLIEAGPAEAQLAQRQAERRNLVELLVHSGLLDAEMAQQLDRAAHNDMPLPGVLMEAVHGFLARTPSMLVAVRIEDLAGERLPVNLPGTVDQYPNWQRKLSASCAEIAAMPGYASVTRRLAAERPRGS